MITMLLTAVGAGFRPPHKTPHNKGHGVQSGNTSIVIAKVVPAQSTRTQLVPYTPFVLPSCHQKRFPLTPNDVIGTTLQIHPAVWRHLLAIIHDNLQQFNEDDGHDNDVIVVDGDCSTCLEHGSTSPCDSCLQLMILMVGLSRYFHRTCGLAAGGGRRGRPKRPSRSPYVLKISRSSSNQSSNAGTADDAGVAGTSSLSQTFVEERHHLLDVIFNLKAALQLSSERERHLERRLVFARQRCVCWQTTPPPSKQPESHIRGQKNFLHKHHQRNQTPNRATMNGVESGSPPPARGSMLAARNVNMSREIGDKAALMRITLASIQDQLAYVSATPVNDTATETAVTSHDNAATSTSSCTHRSIDKQPSTDVNAWSRRRHAQAVAEHCKLPINSITPDASDEQSPAAPYSHMGTRNGKLCDVAKELPRTSDLIAVTKTPNCVDTSSDSLVFDTGRSSFENVVTCSSSKHDAAISEQCASVVCSSSAESSRRRCDHCQVHVCVCRSTTSSRPVADDSSTASGRHQQVHISDKLMELLSSLAELDKNRDRSDKNTGNISLQCDPPISIKESLPVSSECSDQPHSSTFSSNKRTLPQPVVPSHNSPSSKSKLQSSFKVSDQPPYFTGNSASKKRSSDPPMKPSDTARCCPSRGRPAAGTCSPCAERTMQQSSSNQRVVDSATSITDDIVSKPTTDQDIDKTSNADGIDNQSPDGLELGSTMTLRHVADTDQAQDSNRLSGARLAHREMNEKPQEQKNIIEHSPSRKAKPWNYGSRDSVVSSADRDRLTSPTTRLNRSAIIAKKSAGIVQRSFKPDLPIVDNQVTVDCTKVNVDVDEIIKTNDEKSVDTEYYQRECAANTGPWPKDTVATTKSKDDGFSKINGVEQPRGKANIRQVYVEEHSPHTINDTTVNSSKDIVTNPDKTPTRINAIQGQLISHQTSRRNTIQSPPKVDHALQHHQTRPQCDAAIPCSPSDINYSTCNRTTNVEKDESIDRSSAHRISATAATAAAAALSGITEYQRMGRHTNTTRLDTLRGTRTDGISLMSPQGHVGNAQHVAVVGQTSPDPQSVTDDVAERTGMVNIGRPSTTHATTTASASCSTSTDLLSGSEIASSHPVPAATADYVDNMPIDSKCFGREYSVKTGRWLPREAITKTRNGGSSKVKSIRQVHAGEYPPDVIHDTAVNSTADIVTNPDKTPTRINAIQGQLISHQTLRRNTIQSPPKIDHALQHHQTRHQCDAAIPCSPSDINYSTCNRTTNVEKDESIDRSSAHRISATAATAAAAALSGITEYQRMGRHTNTTRLDTLRGTRTDGFSLMSPQGHVGNAQHVAVVDQTSPDPQSVTGDVAERIGMVNIGRPSITYATISTASTTTTTDTPIGPVTVTPRATGSPTNMSKIPQRIGKWVTHNSAADAESRVVHSSCGSPSLMKAVETKKITMTCRPEGREKSLIGSTTANPSNSTGKHSQLTEEDHGLQKASKHNSSTALTTSLESHTSSISVNDRLKTNSSARTNLEAKQSSTECRRVVAAHPTSKIPFILNGKSGLKTSLAGQSKRTLNISSTDSSPIIVTTQGIGSRDEDRTDEECWTEVHLLRRAVTTCDQSAPIKSEDHVSHGCQFAMPPDPEVGEKVDIFVDAVESYSQSDTTSSAHSVSSGPISGSTMTEADNGKESRPLNAMSENVPVNGSLIRMVTNERNGGVVSEKTTAVQSRQTPLTTTGGGAVRIVRMSRTHTPNVTVADQKSSTVLRTGTDIVGGRAFSSADYSGTTTAGLGTTSRSRCTHGVVDSDSLRSNSTSVTTADGRLPQQVSMMSTCVALDQTSPNDPTPESETIDKNGQSTECLASCGASSNRTTRQQWSSSAVTAVKFATQTHRKYQNVVVQLQEEVQGGMGQQTTHKANPRLNAARHVLRNPANAQTSDNATRPPILSRKSPECRGNSFAGHTKKSIPN